MSLGTADTAALSHDPAMSSPIVRAQLIGTWCMSMTTLAAAGIVLGAAITLANMVLLVAGCVVPSAIVLLIWGRVAPVPLAAASCD